MQQLKHWVEGVLVEASGENALAVQADWCTQDPDPMLLPNAKYFLSRIHML